jgi:predicted membrane protein (TIGR00267 family)
MGLAYSAGSIIPIIPYFFAALAGHAAVYSSLALALIGLFCIGVYAGSLSEKNKWLRGLEIALYGSVVFALSFVAGHFIPPLFGAKPGGF